jgi:ArsR family transcriptional regulator, arsenate/arsenite/antimonite-responsive transcriptional repressor
MRGRVIERKLGARCCVPAGAGLEEAEVASLTAALSVLAHPIRLRLLSLIASQPTAVCVCDLEAAVPVKQPTVSHHLRQLRAAGLIALEKRGLWSYYSIRREAWQSLKARLGATLDAIG